MHWDTSELPRSWKEARKVGAKSYFTGKPCIKGHLAPKVTMGGCKECARLRSAAYKEKRRAEGKPLDYSHAVKPGYWEKYRSSPEGKRKLDARNKLIWAVECGKIKRHPCEVCGSTKRIHAHHDNYDKPLDVKWLCALHHQQRHTWLRDNGIQL